MLDREKELEAQKLAEEMNAVLNTAIDESQSVADSVSVDALLPYAQRTLSAEARVKALETGLAQTIPALLKIIRAFEYEVYEEYSGTKLLNDKLAEVDYARTALSILHTLNLPTVDKEKV